MPGAMIDELRLKLAERRLAIGDHRSFEIDVLPIASAAHDATAKPKFAGRSPKTSPAAEIHGLAWAPRTHAQQYDEAPNLEVPRYDEAPNLDDTLSDIAACASSVSVLPRAPISEGTGNGSGTKVTPVRRNQQRQSLERQLAEANAERNGALARSRRLHAEVRRVEAENMKLEHEVQQLRSLISGGNSSSQKTAAVLVPTLAGACSIVDTAELSTPSAASSEPLVAASLPGQPSVAVASVEKLPAAARALDSGSLAPPAPTDIRAAAGSSSSAVVTKPSLASCCSADSLSMNELPADSINFAEMGHLRAGLPGERTLPSGPADFARLHAAAQHAAECMPADSDEIFGGLTRTQCTPLEMRSLAQKIRAEQHFWAQIARDE